MRSPEDRAAKRDAIIQVARAHKAAGTTLTIGEFRVRMHAEGKTIRDALKSVKGEDLLTVIHVQIGKDFR